MKEAQGTHYDSNLYFLIRVSQALIPFRPQYHCWGCGGWMGKGSRMLHGLCMKIPSEPSPPLDLPLDPITTSCFHVNLPHVFSLGFDDPSALLKHELAYCLGQMQVEFTCTCIFAYKMWKLWRALCLVQLGHSHFENFCPRFFSINNLKCKLHI